MRDVLRQDEGSVPAGDAYTLAELSLLARSAVASQRVAALRILEAVILKAKPSHRDLTPAGAPAPRPVVLPADCQEAGRLDWGQVRFNSALESARPLSNVTNPPNIDHSFVQRPGVALPAVRPSRCVSDPLYEN